MTPLLYGYMKVPEEMSDDEIKCAHTEMEHYAEAEGFTLATVFHEFVPESRSAFSELVAAVKASEAHHVIVPTMRDLALSAALQAAMIMHLEFVAGAEVVGLDER